MNTTVTVSILFYKGPGTFVETIIRWWTGSPYAHCEFYRSDGLCHSNDRLRRVSRLQRIEITPAEWEVFPIELPAEIVERIERRQLRKNGTGYDWRGIIFSQVFPWGWHNRHRWFCSKSNADDLAYAYRLMKRTGNKRFDPYLRTLSCFASFPVQCFSPALLHQKLTAGSIEGEIL